MLIKKGIVYQWKLYIRISFNKKVDHTICNRVGCRYGCEDSNNINSRDDTCNECNRCRKARVHFKQITGYSGSKYNFVPYDN